MAMDNEPVRSLSSVMALTIPDLYDIMPICVDSSIHPNQVILQYRIEHNDRMRRGAVGCC
jgi:hypothetical protein